MRIQSAIIILITSGLNSFCFAQMDSLHFFFEGKMRSEKVHYSPMPDTSYFLHTGYYETEGQPLAIQVPFKRGKESGIFKAFYPNGKQMIFAVYGWGKLQGDWAEFDEFGTITLKGQYKSGLRHGSWTYIQKGIRAKYKKGLKHGKWKYYENKVLSKTEKYRKGKLIKTGTFLSGSR